MGDARAASSSEAIGPARQITRDMIVAEARSWINPTTRFVHGHSRKGLAADCVGLVRGVANRLGISDLDEQTPAAAPFIHYARDPNPEMMKRALDAFLVPIDIERRLAGDIAWFAVAGAPSHLAILTGDGYMVHALQQAGKVCEHRLVETKRFQLFAMYAYPGFA